MILPNAANGQMKLLNSTDVSAAATGYIYFDDGVSLEKNVTVVEIFY